MPSLIRYLLATLCVLATLTGSAQYLRTSEFARMDQLDIRSGGGTGNYTQTKPNESFGHRLTIVNNSSQTARFRLEMRENKYFKLLYGSDKVITVQPHDSISVNLKFLNVNARVNGMYTLFIDLINVDEVTDHKSYEFNIEVVDGTERAVYVQPLTENVYIQRQMRDFEVPIMLRNMLPSGTLVSFEVQNQTQVPYKLQSQYQRKMHIPDNDTVVGLKFDLPGQLFEVNRMNTNLTVYMRNDRGDLLGMFTVFARMVTNVGDMLPFYNVLQDQGSSYVEADVNVYGQGDGSINIMANKTMKGNDHFGASLNYMRYNNSGFQFMSNTFLAYKRDNLFLQLGNLNDFHELSLLGRGVKGKMYLSGNAKSEAGTGSEDEQGYKSIEFWAADGEYNLLSPFSMKTGSKVLSVRFNSFEDRRNGFSFSSSYFSRGFVKSEGHLHFGNWQATIGERHHFMVQLGGSQEIFHHPSKDTSLLGYSGKLSYDYVSKRLQANIMAYRGSRDYAGNLQGSTLVGGGVNYRLADRTGLSYLVQKNVLDKPLYTDSSILGRMYNNYTQQSLSLSRRTGRVMMYVKPYTLFQAQTYADPRFDTVHNKLNALRLQFGVNYRLGQLLSMTSLDFGSIAADIQGKGQKSSTGLRFSSYFQHKYLGLSLQWQQGPYYIGDLLALKGDPSSIRIASANLTFTKDMFRRVQYDASVMVQDNSNFDKLQFYMHHRVRVPMGKGFTALARVQVAYGGYRPITQFNLGVRKSFDLSESEKDRADAQFRVFFDKNNNGEKDKGEDWAEDIVFHFDDMSLVTGKDGRVTVKHVEKGWHKFSVLYRNGGAQQSVYEQKLEVDRNQVLEVGVPPQYMIRGHVVEQKNQYLGATRSLEGIKICVRNQSREYFIYTQQNGEFSMQLKPGHYMVSIDQLRRLGIPGVEKEIVVDMDKGFEGNIELIWQNNERKVDIKRIEKN